ncbi:MAG: 4-coumarate--CoA ligase [Pseudomonadota bacterium]
MPETGAGHGHGRNGPVLPRAALLRLLRSLIYATATAPGAAPPPGLARRLFDPAAPIAELGDLALGENGLGFDSLARIDLAAAVAQVFDLGATGRDDYLLLAERLGEWAELVAGALDAAGAAAQLTFHTSGSTDRPKAVPHMLADLLEEVAVITPTLFDPPPDRVVSLVPAHHIYGCLFTCLYPAWIGCDVIDAQHRPAAAVLRALCAGDLVVGTPQNWGHLLGSGNGLPPGVRGVVSAGPMPHALWSQAEAQGLQDLVEIFGATETAGIGWRRAGDQPFALLPHIHRVTDTTLESQRGTRRILQDRVEWRDDRHFVPVGRRDHAVQIAGVNVSLRRVEATIAEAPQVAEAAVRPHGDRLKAFVVPMPPAPADTELRDALNAWTTARLPAPARPVHYSVGPALPRNAMGKLSDWAVPQAAGAGQK